MNKTLERRASRIANELAVWMSAFDIGENEALNNLNLHQFKIGQVSVLVYEFNEQPVVTVFEGDNTFILRDWETRKAA